MYLWVTIPSSAHIVPGVKCSIAPRAPPPPPPPPPPVLWFCLGCFLGGNKMFSTNSRRVNGGKMTTEVKSRTCAPVHGAGGVRHPLWKIPKAPSPSECLQPQPESTRRSDEQTTHDLLQRICANMHARARGQCWRALTSVAMAPSVLHVHSSCTRRNSAKTRATSATKSHPAHAAAVCQHKTARRTDLQRPCQHKHS